MSTANPVVIGYDNFMSSINMKKILAEFPIMVTAIKVQVAVLFSKRSYESSCYLPSFRFTFLIDK